MHPRFRIYRVSNVEKERARLEEVQEVLAKARRVLDDHEPPDTFVGRKTREPFPQEDEF